MMETNIERVYAIIDRRRDLLEPIIQEINPKAFEVQVIEIEVELSDIYSAMFDLKLEEIKAK